jgi:hypothetical protein
MTRAGRPTARGLLASTLLALLAATGAGCEDLRRFEGSWAGGISPDPRHQVGFAPDATLRAFVGGATRAAIDLRIALPGEAAPVPFEPVRHAAGDALGELSLPGEPLRTYLGFLRAAPGPLLAVVSLYPEDRLDVRLVRGPDEVYGVFSLRRERPAGDAGAPSPRR